MRPAGVSSDFLGWAEHWTAADHGRVPLDPPPSV